MKKLFFLIFIGAVAVSCGNDDKTGKANNGQATAAKEDNKDPEVERGLDLVAKSDCFGCHQIKQKSTGPAYEEIAARYPNNEAVIDSLAGKIINGGAGNWGTIPMTAHNGLAEDDAKAMVKYVLSLKP